MRSKQLLIFASLSSALSIILGAFGAHALKDIISPERLQVFETGVRYQLYHSLALLFLGLYININSSFNAKWIARMFKAGIYIFSGSLYLLSCRGILGIESWKWIGAITPFGGILFISAWLLLAFKIYKTVGS
jgi:uncharacterized membrane protein YgdD (TMEM256/DUF423 family)